MNSLKLFVEGDAKEVRDINKMDIKSKIENLIKETLKNLDIEIEEISLEHPADLNMGDFFYQHSYDCG